MDDATTTPALPIFGNPDYAKGYDLVIHDECAAGIKDPAIVKDVLKPHADGLPAVNLHCAMHSYRTGNHKKRVEALGGDNSLWFEFLGLQSSAHGSKTPIAISITDKEHPVTKGAQDWTTIGHNNETVQDACYLDLVAKGCLWACGKLDVEGKAAAGYGKVMK